MTRPSSTKTRPASSGRRGADRKVEPEQKLPSFCDNNTKHINPTEGPRASAAWTLGPILRETHQEYEPARRERLAASRAMGEDPLAWRPTPHPFLPIPGPAEIAELIRTGKLNQDDLKAQLLARERLIELSMSDPFHHGFPLYGWKDADAALDSPDITLVCAFGGNGSGKTFYGAYAGVRLLMERPGARVLWLHEAEKASLLVQQPAVFWYLPAEFKEGIQVKRTNYLKYDPKNGFSSNRFVLPNGSLGCFGYYNQDIDDYEGTGWDLIVADENLPLTWLKTLLVRLPRRRGKFLWTFTAIYGITPAMRDVVAGSKTIQSRPAPLLPSEHVVCADCPPGHAPYIQESTWKGCRILYFFSEDNPFSNYEDYAKLMAREDTQVIERRCYGYARNTCKTAFPRFCSDHLIHPSKIPLTGAVSHYMVIDPAGFRNCFIIWATVDVHGRIFIHREWPDMKSYGPWAEPSGDVRVADGVRGTGQDAVGFGVLEYKDMILRAEGASWDPARRCWTNLLPHITRIVDRRAGKATILAEQLGKATSLIDRFREVQADGDGAERGISLDLECSTGFEIQEGVSLINELLYYDPKAAITPLLNEPKLFISEDCYNVVDAMRNWTGEDGERGAYKDPIDCVRYLAEFEPMYVDRSKPVSYDGGSY